VKDLRVVRPTKAKESSSQIWKSRGHLALQDATGNGIGTVSAEIPVGPRWCEIRQIVFSWTTQKFPFNVKTAHTLNLNRAIALGRLRSPGAEYHNN
jgi:hypothetical protein